MCGIAGALVVGDIPGGRLEPVATAMAATLEHRGPDDAGNWVDPDAGVLLAHRRLSIIDTSPLGHQPMISHSGRYVVSYNGEIYNYRELRAELGDSGFTSSCDTEVLVTAVERWGVHETLCRLNGMFAFALWDRQDRCLHLSRDRMGEKPLYYGTVGSSIVFGSELKALRTFPGWQGTIDRTAVSAFLGLGYIPSPLSIYEGIRKLPAGTVLTVRHGAAPGVPEPYWTLASAVRHGAPGRHRERSAADVADELEALLVDAVGMRMVADVPVGAFLSGGIDSSLVVSLMQRHHHAPVRTFTIGYEDAAFDESGEADKIARHLGTDHTCVAVRSAEALDVIPRLPAMYDEPFADASQIPTYLVSEVARRAVTVSLSGDGGDELFGGYNRYTWSGQIWPALQRWPGPARRIGGAALGVVPTRVWDAAFGPRSAVVPRRYRVRTPGTKVAKLARVLPSRSSDEMYDRLVAHWSPPPVAGAVVWHDAGEQPAGLGDVERMMYRDTVTYLPDDIMAKVDRASMAVSLECRAPFLDHRVAELAWSLPLDGKIAGGVGKLPLREVLRRYVPDHLVDHPKMGFGVPLGAWLRGPLRQWGEDLLDEATLREEGLVDPAVVRRAWAEHQSGAADRETELWDVLTLQAWLAAR